MGSCGVDAIRGAGGHAVELLGYFAQGTPDVDFLPELHNHCHAFVTRDVAMRSNEQERLALQICRVHVFIVRGGGLKLDDLKALVRGSFAKMRRYVNNHATPFLARVTKSDVVVVSTGGRRGGIKRD